MNYQEHNKDSKTPRLWGYTTAAPALSAGSFSRICKNVQECMPVAVLHSWVQCAGDYRFLAEGRTCVIHLSWQPIGKEQKGIAMIINIVDDEIWAD